MSVISESSLTTRMPIVNNIDNNLSLNKSNIGTCGPIQFPSRSIEVSKHPAGSYFRNYIRKVKADVVLTGSHFLSLRTLRGSVGALEPNIKLRNIDLESSAPQFGFT